MRRWIAASTATVAAAVLLTACASGGSSDSGGSEGDGDGVTLTYGVWSQDETMQQLIDAFEAENPDISVELQVSPWTEYWTELQVSAQGGTAPDAFWMLGDRFQVYAANDQLLPLGDAISDAGIDLGVYPEALVDLFTYNDELYGLPKDFDTIGLWYNKALFDAAGVAYPTDQWTWEDVRTAAEQLTNAEAGVYGIAAPFNRQEGYYNTVAQAGGYIIEDGKSGYSDPKTQEGIQFWTDLQAAGVSPTLEEFADTEAVAQFENGTVAMYYGGSFYAQRFYDNEELRANVDVTVLPQGAERATVINGIQNVGFAGTDHPEELKKFLLFLGGEEAAQIQAETGAVIPAYEGTQQAWVDSMPEFNLQAFIDEVPYGVVYPVSADTAAWNALEDEYLPPAWNGTTTVQEAADQLAEAMDAALAEEE
ncbi:multiple sugar transport system substrate-binding protein [Microbacterium sp. AK009]|uniref:ABC transporter substrate-binding protein n=1 Tax=Microbacterium sp. AK009 TaxID=2723068 RepID=UPI0015CCFE08|nr:sugar ABC transporter substrate-binding protein [Microbacterium sp. AK009]NYF16023.1 multiple sugar transport system substrate-binding protein [Microbacterium sp. AK009]